MTVEIVIALNHLEVYFETRCPDVWLSMTGSSDNPPIAIPDYSLPFSLRVFFLCWNKREREREREGERERERERNRETEREREREREKERERERVGASETEQKTDRQTHWICC